MKTLSAACLWLPSLRRIYFRQDSSLGTAVEKNSSDADYAEVSLASLCSRTSSAEVSSWWATNGKSCRAMRAASERLNGQFAAQGVMFLSVNEDAQQKAWKDSLIGKPSPLIEVRDEKHSFRRTMHVASLPAALVFDRRGHVRWRGSWTSASETKASEALARLLQEH
jgi:hypothetical protein